MIDFLLEIGFEEFPPSFLAATALDLSAKIETLLKKEKIFYRTIRTIYTARRAGAIILGLARKQKPQVIETQGPPAKFAYDKEGKPTDTLAGFMKAHNFKPGDIKTVRTEKGEYVVGIKEATGESTEEILHREIPKIIESLEFPKTMVWNETMARFPRPIRSIIALLDRRPLRFKIAGIQADRYCIPNFHFSFNPIRLEKPREYLTFLRHGGVVADPNERRKIIINQIKELGSKLKGEPVYDDAMVEEINCTVEYPDVVSGTFDEQFLELPSEVLMTALKALGNLIWVKNSNKFICVFSAKRRAAENVGIGYAKVLKSRLYDAHFYYKIDLKQGIEDMLRQSREMVWLQGLGSIYNKSVRIAKMLEGFGLAGVDENVLRQAATYCKSDLLSHMVREKEFTSLQGIMGGYYARDAGKDERISLAIKEHYRPKFIGDALPSTKEGAALSIADKIDNVVGAFLSGQKPSGSYDPLGVRRNGYAVVNLIDANGFNFSINSAVAKLLDIYERDFDKTIINEFFAERLGRYLEDKGMRYDEINSALADSNGNAYDIRLRCEALKNYRGKPEFVQLVVGQKRVRNILKGVSDTEKVDPLLFEMDAEKKLYNRGQEVMEKLAPLFNKQEYAAILDALLSMRPDIDRFFDDVLVMCEDKKLKNNRLALVSYINRLFIKFADLSQIVIEADEKKRKK